MAAGASKRRSPVHRTGNAGPIHSEDVLPSVTLIGIGNWGMALALALQDARVPFREFIVRKKRSSDQKLASAMGAQLTTMAKATLDADILWICTPDGAISSVASELADRLDKLRQRPSPLRATKRINQHTKLMVFHSSGALASTELAALQRVGASIASVHPLMTFPRRAVFAQKQPGRNTAPLAHVPFAVEGDPNAGQTARRLVRAMQGEPFSLRVEDKPLYHAFGAFTSPLLIALLTAATQTAMTAGYTAQEARRRMRPIVERTMANFFADGPDKSFSGPIARGDAATVARHLEALRAYPRLAAAYKELSLFALGSLPASNKAKIRQFLARPINNSASRAMVRASTA